MPSYQEQHADLFLLRNVAIIRLLYLKKKIHFFAGVFSSDKKSEDETPLANTSSDTSEKSFEEQVEEMTKQEMEKVRKASRLKMADGQQYAPWMKVSDEEEAKIRQVMKEKAAIRMKRQMEEQRVSGSLLTDSQAQELSGSGLRAKVIDSSSIELEWATSAEVSTKGFAIKRRKARTEDFDIIVSYENYGPLASKGPDGGKYRFLDDTVSPGGWVYRVTEYDVSGAESDICQALVDIQTEEEQKGVVIAAAAMAVLVGGIFAAGALLDPMQGN